MKKLISVLAAVAAGAALAATNVANAAGTLATVKQHGYVTCGVNTGLPGFSQPDSKGHWTGIDADTCRAVAAAIFGDASKVKFVPLTAKERFTALQSGEVDVLIRNTTWTLSRDASLGLNFTGTNYYDGQGFLVKKSLGVKSAKDLNGATICVLSGTTTELNLAGYFRFHNMKYQPLVFDTSDQTDQAFSKGRCDALTSDRSQLAALRSKLPDPSSAVLLPEVISKEPLGPVVREGDDEWFNIVKWALFAQIDAEEMGITSKNVDQMKNSKNPDVERLLGVNGDMGAKLHLSNDWAYNIVKEVGNYGEMFARNIGEGTPLNLDRGLNALWTNGGILYAPPVR